jgi:hypothetical protein
MVKSKKQGDPIKDVRKEPAVSEENKWSAENQFLQDRCKDNACQKYNPHGILLKEKVHGMPSQIKGCAAFKNPNAHSKDQAYKEGKSQQSD